MKSYIKAFTIIAAAGVLAGCSENAWNDHLGGFTEPPVAPGTKTIDYNLTASDYSTIASLSANSALASTDEEKAALKAIGANGYFASEAQAQKYIPAFLASSGFPYFTLNNGSSIKVGFNVPSNQPAEVTAINSGVATYTVSQEDYVAAWGSDEDFIQGFAPITPASANIPSILLTALPEAKEGEYAVVAYQETDSNPIFTGGNAAPSVYLEETFAEGQGAFSIENVKLPEGSDYIWAHDAKYGCMKASGYVNKVNYETESWLISPEMSLPEDANAILTFDQAVQYFTDVETALKEASVNIREKNGEWVKLEVTNIPEKTSWDFVPSGDIDLSAFNGKTVEIGFRYTSTAEKAGTWEVNNVKIMQNVPSKVAAKAPAAEMVMTSKNDLYLFNGKEWAQPKSMLILQPADYTEMGQKYGNLSGTLPEEMLPTYAAKALPYAAEEESVIVVYKYYDANKVTSFKAAQLTKTEGVWVINQGATVNKFTKKDNVWSYNPSVELTLPYSTNTDPTYTYFMACKDWVFNNVTKKLYPDAQPANGSKPGPPFIDYRNNAEFYSGASAYYGNVDVRASTAVNNAPEGYDAYEGMSDEEITELIKTRFVKETFPGALTILHPDAKPVEGMDITYTFTFASYDGTATMETVVYTVTGPGEFTYKSCTWWDK